MKIVQFVRFDLKKFDGYADNMWPSAQKIAAVVLVFGLSFGADRALAETSDQAIVPVDDYAIYNQVVTNKFLTSQTRLVLIERMTASRLYLDQDGPTTLGMFNEQSYFDRRLPPDLVREFVFKNRQQARMGGHFNFGVPYRFVSADGEEESTVSVAIPAAWSPAVLTQDLSLLGRLTFSRVAYTLRSDQALVYVEQHRPDGTGAGFLVWLIRDGTIWSIFDTEVLWSLREQSRGLE